MKKLVCIVFILVILNEFAATTGLKEEWQKFKTTYEKGKLWLIGQHLWGPLVTVIKLRGRDFGIRVCEKMRKDPTICTDIVDWIIVNLKKN